MWCRAGRCPHRGVGASPTTRRPCSRATRDFIRCVVIGSWVRGGGGGSRPGTTHRERLPPLMQAAGAATASTTRRGLLSSAAGGCGGCSCHAASAATPRSHLRHCSPLEIYPSRGLCKPPSGPPAGLQPLCQPPRAAPPRSHPPHAGRPMRRAERRRFARRSRALRDEETTLDPDLEWGRGCQGELMGWFGRGLLGWAVARSPRGATSRSLAFTYLI